MSLLDVVGALRRFSAVFLTIVLATAGATYFVWTQVPVVYLSEASMVILLPNQEEGQDRRVPSNPYQSVGDSAASVAAEALVSIGNSPEFQARLANQGVLSVNTIEIGEIGGGVIIALTATNTEPANAKADLSALATIIAQELRTRQIESGAPESLLLTADVLIAPSEPIPLTSKRITVAGAVAVLGIIIALAAVILLEFLHRPRRVSAKKLNQSVSSEKADRRIDGGAEGSLPPATSVPDVLAVIDQALALSRPQPVDEMQSEDPPSEVLALPFDDPIEHRVSAGSPVREGESSLDLAVTSYDDGDDDLEDSSALAGWEIREQLTHAEREESRSDLDDGEEGSVGRESGRVSFIRS